MADLEGAMLSDYLLQHCIAKGGVADVYRARLISDKVDAEAKPFEVAVKIFRSAYAQREAFRDYFMTEAEKIGQFDHPHILPFLEYGEGENLLYLVTPFIETGTLEDLLRRVGGRFSATQALPIVQQLCGAVQYAHDHGIAHGNIKPSNVFVAPDGRMLLADFGIAHGFDDSQQSLTRVGWGSAEYAAPEQSLGVLRPTSDIYSLGIVFFRILTSSPPFTGHTPVEVLLKHVRQAPPSARSLVPLISEAVDAVLARAMRKRSDERFTSVEELSRAYTQAVLVSPVASPVARAMTTAKLTSPLLMQPISVVGPHTPNPTLYGDVSESPQTPIPTLSDTALTWKSDATDALLPEVEALSSHNRGEDSNVGIAEYGIGYNGETSTAHFWSVDPVEWSPIAEDEQTLPGVPMSASEYLDENVSVLEKSKTDQQADVEAKVTFQARLWKWLPLIVVILLFAGLLAAILSAFFYPGNSSGADLLRHNPLVFYLRK